MYDTDALVKRWDNKILMSLLADILRMGQDSAGSYALASEKSSIMNLAIESRLREIQDVLNNDLVKQLFLLNGYASDEELPKLQYTDFDTVSLDEFSKAVQRMFSVGAVEFDRPVANKVRKALGVDQKPETEPVDKESLSNTTSRSGDGMVSPGEGTSTSPMDSDDAGAGNMENA